MRIKKGFFEEFSAIIFDADDTLWDCQTHFEAMENRLYEMISPWTDNPKRELFNTESGNMADLGYGAKAFTISILETAIRVSHGEIEASKVGELLQMGKDLLHFPALPLPGVEETLSEIRKLGMPMILFTKGELQDQENKLRRSGLAGYFDDVVITSNKSEKEFRELCERLDMKPAELVMIGNSFKSDIAPAVAVGMKAIHIPFYVTWQLETFEEFEHENVIKLNEFRDIMGLIQNE